MTIRFSGLGSVALFLGIWTLVWLPIAVPLAIAVKWRPAQPLTLGQKLPLLASLYLLAPLCLWGWSRWQQIPLSAYGLDWHHLNGLQFASGLGIGALGIGALYGVQGLWGWVQWRPPIAIAPEAPPSNPSSSSPIAATPLLSTLVLTVLLGIWVGLTEEWIFRGFFQLQLQQDYAPWIAAAIASLIFALLHLVWEGQENIPQLPGLWLMGMVLGVACWVSNGQLELAWGLHAGWIWAIASLDSLNLVSYTGREIVWLSGAEGKPLAGGLGLLFLLVTGLLLQASAGLTGA